MSRHHIMPPVTYTPPPPKKIETKKRRIGIGQLGELDETADTRESSGTGQSAPVANKLLQQNYPDIEGSDRKPRGPQGRLSQGMLSALLQVQELE
jgi:hypothetical protein